MSEMVRETVSTNKMMTSKQLQQQKSCNYKPAIPPSSIICIIGKLVYTLYEG